MVNAVVSFFALTALVFVSGTSAVPRKAFDVAEHVPFSMEAWAVARAKDPDSDHLTPDEAFLAFEATHNDTTIEIGDETVEKRQHWGQCASQPRRDAPIPDVIRCIDRLVAKGGLCRIPGNSNVWCNAGRARVQGQLAGGDRNRSVHCQRVAQTVGAILDLCARNDGTVQGGHQTFGNSVIFTNVYRPT